MITVIIRVNKRMVGKITAVNTECQHKNGKYEYQVNGWATNYKKGTRYTISENIILTQHGSSPKFVSKLLGKVNDSMEKVDASVIGATIPKEIHNEH